MSTVLSDIVRYKQREIAAAKARTSQKLLRERAESAPPVRNFRQALLTARPGLIAEVKKASPSAGIIRADFDPVAIAREYEAAGAQCLSVLTDEKYFQGHLDFLESIRRTVELPVMRKEFILDHWQILEARAAGADCVLLIAECLTDEQLSELHGFATELGMQTLIELYDADNLPRVVKTGTQMIGINNRDLRTFETSLEHTFHLVSQVPDNVLLISESGIRTHDDVRRLSDAGVGGVLVGESLMRQPDIGAAVRELMHGPGRASR